MSFWCLVGRATLEYYLRFLKEYPHSTSRPKFFLNTVVQLEPFSYRVYFNGDILQSWIQKELQLITSFTIKIENPWNSKVVLGYGRRIMRPDFFKSCINQTLPKKFHLLYRTQSFRFGLYCRKIIFFL